MPDESLEIIVINNEDGVLVDMRNKQSELIG